MKELQAYITCGNLVSYLDDWRQLVDARGFENIVVGDAMVC